MGQVKITGSRNVIGAVNLSGNRSTVTVNIGPSGAAADPHQVATRPPEPEQKPTRSSLRKLLGRVLPTDSELDAFSLDYFPQTKRLFSNAMNTAQKCSLLLEREDANEILNRLEEAAPDALRKHSHLLIFA